MKGVVMKDRVDEMLAAATLASQQPDAHWLLPYIIRSLQAIQNAYLSTTPGHKSLVKAAGALGRIVTDDFAFSESPLGQSLLDLINEIVSEPTG